MSMVKVYGATVELLTWIIEIWFLVLHDVGHLLKEDPVLPLNLGVAP